uniref:uncharacterized protein LOC120330065 isoform X3 n=1 Tax=Styela clava TaxID=7725 RepID=UPI0019397DE1|nr:uncharacterized protein LOC120330065 isoform X3 [Styela clava]
MFILKRGRYILLLMLVQSFEFIQTKQCNIPEVNEDIDWDNFSEAWYEVLHTFDPVMDKDVFGAKLHNFTKTSTGMNLIVTELHKNSPPQTYAVHHTRKKAGIYRAANNDEPAIKASQSLTPEGGRSEDAAKIDEWVVWVAFPSMNPTIQQLTLMWNKLMEKQINVQLYLSESVKHPENFMGFNR